MCYREISLSNYMPLCYLDSLFSKGIYFGRVSSFNDSLEGGLFKKPILNGVMDTDILIMVDTLKLDANIEDCRSVLSSVLEDRNKFISCWHHNDKFSDHMWKNYASKSGFDGVYIKTTSLNVYQAINSEHRQFFESDGYSFLFHKVNYIDSVDSVPYGDVKNIVKEMLSFYYKKGVWALENEYRMIINASKLNLYTGLFVDGCSEVITSGIEKISEDAIEKITIEDGAIYIPIDPMKMVVEIGVEEQGYEQVCQICKKYNIDSKVIRVIKV